MDKEFGTGCVKITPAHDPNDFLVGQRHGLEQIRVMNDDATINRFGGKYEGLDRYEARRRIVEDLPRVMQKYNINDLNDIIGGAHHE